MQIEWLQSDEQVTVNQRHLIDKILARYSTEFTIFRELVQNSNDAGATQVSIDFAESRIVYRNNGRVFSSQDWDRLRKIAEGNPDEEKIGFFGVGFYSLFSVCEEPLISSGSNVLRFFWKGDQLYTKRGEISSFDEWTTFDLQLRSKQETPDLNVFGKFLATSLAFTKNLSTVVVSVDRRQVLKFDKTIQPSKPIEINSKTFKTWSPNQMFHLQKFESNWVQLTCNEHQIVMRICTGYFDTNLSNKFINEMQRSTKKRPPKRIETSILWSEEEMSPNDMFKDLIPIVGQQGRVFIGFPTHQTTGCSIHFAGYFIPTVERESIDFVDKTLNIWNQQVLSTVGLLSRILYHQEMMLIQSRMIQQPEQATEEWAVQRANHTMASFTFQQTTPSFVIGQIVGMLFYQCSDELLLIYSTKGVLPCDQVRYLEPTDELLQEFIKDVPIVPQKIVKNCQKLIEELLQKDLLKPVGLQDILKEISNRILSRKQVICCLKWWIKLRLNNQVSFDVVDRFNKSLMIHEMPLNMFKYYLNPKLIPPELPQPCQTLPYEISKEFKSNELQCFIGDGLVELSLVTWTGFIIGHDSIRSDPAFSEKILGTMSRSFNQQNSTDKASICSLLENVPCIPTKEHGMLVPRETYFKNVNLFKDIPIVFFPSMSKQESRGLFSSIANTLFNRCPVSEAFLLLLGVREHVDLQMVFDRLDDLNWNHVQLIRYLASVSFKLSDDEFQRLCNMPLIERQGKRMKVSDLYCPLEELRQLGVECLDWPKWSKYSEEGQFLIRLGLQSLVPIDRLIGMIQQEKEKAKFLQYFINKRHLYTTYHPSINQAFLPCMSLEQVDLLCKPSKCYSDAGCLIMGFNILLPEWQQHAKLFGVEANPSTGFLLERLAKHPPSPADAQLVFSYLANRSGDFTKYDWQLVATMKFIPVKDKHSDPNSVYFAKENNSSFVDHFDFVDFGSGNAFLRSCGVKDEPTPCELAQQLLKDPSKFLESGLESYLSLLRQLAVHLNALKLNTKLFKEMQQQPFLIGLKTMGNLTFQLTTASEVYLIDDTILNQIFSPLGCPLEAILETMYNELGSKWLSSQVKEKYYPNGTAQTTENSIKLKELLHERASLLCYEGMVVSNKKDLVNNAENRIKSLSVLQVPQIIIQREFNGTIDKQTTGACIMETSRNQVVFIVDDFDYFDVASCLCPLILIKPRLNDRLLISTLLSTSLMNLKQKGFPIDRVFSLEESQKKLQVAQEIKKKSRVDDAIDTLIGMFPNVSKQQLRDMVVECVNQKDPVQSVAEILKEETKHRHSKTRQQSKSSTQQSASSQQSIQSASSQQSIQHSISSQRSIGQHSNSSQSLISSNDSKSLVSQLKKGLTSFFDMKPVTRLITSTSVTKDFTYNLRSSLQDSLKTLRRTTSNSLDVNIPLDPPCLPPTEASSHCQVIPISNLELLGRIDNIPIYIDKQIPDKSQWLDKPSVKQFCYLLTMLKSVFNLKDSAHVYYDLNATIAFNRNRSLFFNVRYFDALHYDQFKQLTSEPFVYWFLVVCHELAHNFVSVHNADHEFYLSSFAEHFMTRFMQELVENGITLNDPMKTSY